MINPTIIKVKQGIKTLSFGLILDDAQRWAVEKVLHFLKQGNIIDSYNMEVKNDI